MGALHLTTWLGMQGVGQVTLILGMILIIFVLLFKEGLVPTVGNLLVRVLGVRSNDAAKKKDHK